MDCVERLAPGEDPEIVDLFLEQAEEMVGTLRSELNGRGHRLAPKIGDIMRMVHRFKGDAQFLQLPECYQLAQALEHSCLQVFEQPNPPTEEAVRVLKQGLALVEKRCGGPRSELQEDEHSFIQLASQGN